MRSLAIRSLAFSLVLASTFAASQIQQNLDAQSKHPINATPAPNLTNATVPPNLEKRPRMSDGTRIQLIQLMNAEFVRVRKAFPIGYKDITVTPEGIIKPDEGHLYQLAGTYGAAAKVGDRVKITNIVFHEKSVYVEINGGPKKKTKWYQHVSISGMGGSVGGQDPNAAQATGAAFSLEFKHYVPEMSGAELKQFLNPVFDWSVKSASEVYLDTLPPKVKDAIKNHEVLVGMNRDMVVMARERPPQKLREKDEKGQEYEEWIYGTPPQDVTFVRFKGDEVAQVKTMKVGGATVLKTEKEVDVKEGVVAVASVAGQGTAPTAEAAQQEAQTASEPPKKRPTLKRPGEEDDPAVAHPASTSTGGVNDHKSVPQWGTDGQEQPPVPVDPQKPPQ